MIHSPLDDPLDSQTAGEALRDRKPAFLVTIDTEGDNAWVPHPAPTTLNARFLARFQNLCEDYSLKPSWLTTWEMANDRVFAEMAADALSRRQAEVGMHLHAWSQPPFDFRITDADWKYSTYLVEYPRQAMAEKIKTLTDLLQSRFETPMLSHRAGRWAFDERYAEILITEGYMVDCSVTPYVSWEQHLGSPNGSGGADYRAFPESEYFISTEDISRPGCSPLMELPMTILPSEDNCLMKSVRKLANRTSAERVVNRFKPRVEWLRPNGRNLGSMLEILNRASTDQRPYVEFMLHSSELMPGGSPNFATRRSIERLYADLEALFAHAAARFEGMTLSEYRLRRGAQGQAGPRP